jgi:hypothetical protein
VRNRVLFLAVLAILILPMTQQSAPGSRLSRTSSYMVLADGTTDPSGGHTSTANLKVATPYSSNKQYRAGQRRGTLPAFIEIIASLLSAIRLL